MSHRGRAGGNITDQHQVALPVLEVLVGYAASPQAHRVKASFGMRRRPPTLTELRSPSWMAQYIVDRLVSVTLAAWGIEYVSCSSEELLFIV